MIYSLFRRQVLLKVKHLKKKNEYFVLISMEQYSQLTGTDINHVTLVSIEQ